MALWLLGSRWWFLVSWQASEVAEESRGPVHVRSFVALEQRARAAARPGQTVVGPFVRRAALEKVYRLEVTRSGEWDHQILEGGDVLYLPPQPVRIGFPHAHAIDDVAGGAVVVLGEVEIGP